MDQDATWYHGGRIRLRLHCVTWGTSSPKGAQPSSFRPMSIVAKRSPKTLVCFVSGRNNTVAVGVVVGVAILVVIVTILAVLIYGCVVLDNR